MTILAIAVIGVTGAALYAFIGTRDSGQYRAEVPGDGSNAVGTPPVASPPAAARGRIRTISVTPDKAEIRTPLVILRVGEGGDARPVVVLGRPEVSRDLKDVRVRVRPSWNAS